MYQVRIFKLAAVVASLLTLIFFSVEASVCRGQGREARMTALDSHEAEHHQWNHSPQERVVLVATADLAAGTSIHSGNSARINWSSWADAPVPETAIDCLGSAMGFVTRKPLPAGTVIRLEQLRPRGEFSLSNPRIPDTNTKPSSSFRLSAASSVNPSSVNRKKAETSSVCGTSRSSSQVSATVAESTDAEPSDAELADADPMVEQLENFRRRLGNAIAQTLDDVEVLTRPKGASGGPRLSDKVFREKIQQLARQEMQRQSSQPPGAASQLSSARQNQAAAKSQQSPATNAPFRANVTVPVIKSQGGVLARLSAPAPRSPNGPLQVRDHAVPKDKLQNGSQAPSFSAGRSHLPNQNAFPPHHAYRSIAPPSSHVSSAAVGTLSNTVDVYIEPGKNPVNQYYQPAQQASQFPGWQIPGVPVPPQQVYQFPNGGHVRVAPIHPPNWQPLRSAQLPPSQIGGLPPKDQIQYSKVRQIARKLDLVAADLEDLQNFEGADEVREVAAKLRKSVRKQSGRASKVQRNPPGFQPPRPPRRKPPAGSNRTRPPKSASLNNPLIPLKPSDR